jgi:hypothetical protein
LLNDTETFQHGTLRIDLAALGFAGPVTAYELISGKPFQAAGDSEIELNPQEAKVIELQSAR